MEDSSTSFDDSRAPLKLLLFIDKRPSLAAQVRQIKEYLTTLETDFAFSLEGVDIGEQVGDHALDLGAVGVDRR